MKKTLFLISTFVLFFIYGVNSQSIDRGTTERNSSANSQLVPINDNNVSTVISNYVETDRMLQNTKINRSVSSGDHFIINIPPLESLILRYDPTTNLVEQFRFNRYTSLTKKALSAIEKAPLWLRSDLCDLFSQLNWEYQHKWADCILEAQDPYIDEIAFSISALSPKYLRSEYAYKEMIKLNAQLIYKYDSILKYVKVIDYGDSKSKDDYYSTTSYIQKDLYGNNYEVEIPREIYYLYVVHPKLTDETPGFVNPDKIENPINSNLTTPENGEFWRDYVVNHKDNNIPNLNFGSFTSDVKDNSRLLSSDYYGWDQLKSLSQNLSDSLKNVDVLWDGVTMQGRAESYTKVHAMALLNRYVQSVMHFWSTSQERPHQPVRILRWGVGRCGEHQDLALAIARTALIPCSGIMASSSDHVWNGIYYNGRWVGWEPLGGFVNRGYFDGDNHRWASVYVLQSSGTSVADVVKDYSGQSGRITIQVIDKYSKPIDGARVQLYAADENNQSIFLDNIRITDFEGKVKFEVGEGRKYYAKVYALGEIKPTGNTVSSVTKDMAVEPGKLYESKFRLMTVTLEQLDCTVISDSRTKGNNKALLIDVKVQDEYIFGQNPLNDLGVLQTKEHKINNATFDFFELNGWNFNSYQNGEKINIFTDKQSLKSFDSIIQLTENEASYFFIRNKEVNNRIRLAGKIAFIDQGDTNYINIGLGDQNLIPTSVAEMVIKGNNMNIFPNPFNDQLTISYNQINEAQLARIVVYDILGKQVKTIELKSNSYSCVLDFPVLQKGIYNCNLLINGVLVDSQKIIKL